MGPYYQGLRTESIEMETKIFEFDFGLNNEVDPFGLCLD